MTDYSRLMNNLKKSDWSNLTRISHPIQGLRSTLVCEYKCSLHNKHPFLAKIIYR